LVHILYFLGLRIEELTTHTWNAFRQIENQWWFFVKGKGDKKAKIPVNDQLLRSLIQYRLFLRKPPLPLVEDKAPLIHSFRTGKAITPRQVNKILKKLALATADKFKDYPDKVKKIKNSLHIGYGIYQPLSKIVQELPLNTFARTCAMKMMKQPDDMCTLLIKSDIMICKNSPSEWIFYFKTRKRLTCHYASRPLEGS
jgi:hypothetical protein